jgi:formiminotetrahydrofolate cyclodeaminase
VTDLDEFMERLSSADPVPGGGSVAALECAMGAALLVMVANLTVGRKKYAEVEVRAMQIRDEALALRTRASGLAIADARAYGKVAAVLEMPKDTEEQKAVRRERMQRALQGAVEPPLETMQSASRVLDLAAELMTIGNRSAISDVGTAAGAVRSSFDAARLNVEINLASIRDGIWVQGIRSKLDNFPSVATRADEISRYVLSVIRS